MTPMSVDLELLQTFIPAGVSWREGRPVVSLAHLGERRLVEPFFEQTIDVCKRSPGALPPRELPLDELGALVDAAPALPLAGIVLHVSRCGSTLLSQMLAAMPSNVVASEPPALDPLIRPPGTPDADAQVRWLRWMVAALGQRRREGDERVLVKLDCWHTLALPLVRRAFPGVPLVFVYRDPLEVVVSLYRRPGRQLLAAVVSPPTYGIDFVEAMTISREQYAARVVGAILQAALAEAKSGSLRLVDYTELPRAALSIARDTFGIVPSGADEQAMRDAARRDVKRPSVRFVPDTAKKREIASDVIRAECARWAHPAYDALRALRG